MKHLPTPTAALAFALLVSSCRDGDVVAYRVPKEHARPSPSSPAAHAHDAATPPHATAGAPGGDMTGSPVATAAGPGLTWTAPASWQATPGSAVRKATFAITGENGAAADLAVTAFPGDVGGEIANVNRWRGQLGLAPADAVAIAQAITRLEHNGLQIGVVDLHDPSGQSAVRLLGAMVPYAGATWFFKLLGPDALVAREKPAFLAFLATVKPAAIAADHASAP